MSKESDKELPSNVFEGMVSVRALISEMTFNPNGRKIIRLLYDRGRVEKQPREYDYLNRCAAEFGFTLEIADRAAIDAEALGTSHGGVIAFCTDREFPAADADKIPPLGFYVLLDGVEDPYNFGYALRSIYASGANGVVMSPRNWMSAAGVVCRSSAGASERMELLRCEDEADAIQTFRSCGYKIVCALENSVSAYDADLKKPLLLVVGGEKRGISKKLYQYFDLSVKLEYGRSFSEALSTASAASILAFEVYRQNRKKV